MNELLKQIDEFIDTAITAITERREQMSAEEQEKQTALVNAVAAYTGNDAKSANHFVQGLKQLALDLVRLGGGKSEMLRNAARDACKKVLEDEREEVAA